MREIKFRAWNKEMEIMCYDNEDGSKDYLDGARASKIGFINYHLTIPKEDDFAFRMRYEVMQYTGLKDKNGVEIYEGDIVEENEQYAVCCWIDEVASFAFVPTEVFPAKDFITIHETYGLDTFFRNDVPEQFVDVIGNIYEHPHLLEVS